MKAEVGLSIPDSDLRLPLVVVLLAVATFGMALAGCGSKDSTFTLASTAFLDGGTLPVVYTGDGVGMSPPLEWTGVPRGTAEFAVMMTTLARDGLKWNWVLYHIRGNVTSLAESTKGVGIAGLTSDGPEPRYYPPSSKGPGPRTYTFTVYALSGSPTFDVPADQVNGEILTSAIRQLTLDSSRLSVTYTRAETMNDKR